MGLGFRAKGLGVPLGSRFGLLSGSYRGLGSGFRDPTGFREKGFRVKGLGVKDLEV